MILDRLENADRYAELHPRFAEAFAWLRANKDKGLPAGKVEIDGKALYVSVDHKDGRGHDGAKMETHKRYIDIQFAVEGTDEIGWTTLGRCRQPKADYDEAKDVTFFADPAETWVRVEPGAMAIFFPEDAHAPLGAETSAKLKKLIVKVAI